MVANRYIPDRGDFVWIDLNPQQGHEQSGRRPAIVLSPKTYNRKTGLCVICPATRQSKGYAFEVEHVSPRGQQGVILSDHVRNVDWQVRKAQFICRVSQEVLDEVTDKLSALIIDPEEA